MLYLIPFLHQTTTLALWMFFKCCCILFHFYIKPQLFVTFGQIFGCCILFHFYIKPQQLSAQYSLNKSCILFHFYIKPQRFDFLFVYPFCCILFHFYIKPQRSGFSIPPQCVVSYSISTSNHNRLIIKTFIIGVVSYSISTSNHNVISFLVVL